jgi:hypothetical protein
MASSRKRITWKDLAPKPAVDPNFVEAAIQLANENPTSSKPLEMQSFVTRMDDLSKAMELVKSLQPERHSEAYDILVANFLMGKPPVSEPQRIVIPIPRFDTSLLFYPNWATIGK